MLREHQEVHAHGLRALALGDRSVEIDESFGELCIRNRCQYRICVTHRYRPFAKGSEIALTIFVHPDEGTVGKPSSSEGGDDLFDGGPGRGHGASSREVPE